MKIGCNSPTISSSGYFIRRLYCAKNGAKRNAQYKRRIKYPLELIVRTYTRQPCRATTLDYLH